MELFDSGKGLISQDEWIKRINELKPSFELSDSEDVIASNVRRLAEDVIKARLEGLDSVGICFSGGLDSSFIAAVCKKQKANFTCYTVGFQDGNMNVPEDILHAREVARHLKLDEDEFREKIFDI